MNINCKDFPPIKSIVFRYIETLNNKCFSFYTILRGEKKLPRGIYSIYYIMINKYMYITVIK